MRKLFFTVSRLLFSGKKRNLCYNDMHKHLYCVGMHQPAKELLLLKTIHGWKSHSSSKNFLHGETFYLSDRIPYLSVEKRGEYILL
ncbi:hypothetical protein C0R09_08095 [Brevibacillus laterosporus]|nr:hypothetical protein C0R09_08095 [Brevibacillus laterosporus]